MFKPFLQIAVNLGGRDQKCYVFQCERQKLRPPCLLFNESSIQPAFGIYIYLQYLNDKGASG